MGGKDKNKVLEGINIPKPMVNRYVLRERERRGEKKSLRCRQGEVVLFASDEGGWMG